MGRKDFEIQGLFSFRNQDYGILEEKVKSILKHYPDFRLGWGKKVCTSVFDILSVSKSL
jgi:hypothetical protein